jgi:hypothetical protein
VPLPIHIAILSLTKDVSTRSLLQVTAALQKQVTRDFGPMWAVSATVDAFGDLDTVPNDYLPIVIFGETEELCDELVSLVGQEPAARLADQFESRSIAGVHLNALTRQPFALVSANDAWTVMVSHELLEMLADPYGNKLVAAAHPTRPRERVRYLIEVCDPCCSRWYPVNGVPVSDFYTPRYFDPVRAPGVRYSFTGALEFPRQILENGYLTYIDPSDSRLYQQQFGEPEPVELAGLAELARSSVPLRTFVDSNPRTPRLNPISLRAADTADAADDPYRGVSEASRGAALNTAEALWSLARGIG